jgi:hypothetical protein
MIRTKFIAVVAILLLAIGTVRAEDNDFKGLPGLWKTTSQIEGGGPSVQTQIKWHCVDEDDDPWIAFVHLQVSPQASCKRVGFSKTSDSLKWRLECSGAFAIINEGSLIFNTPLHYSGKVKLTGTMMGYPIEQTIDITGEHRAACTSPSD